MSGLSVVHVVRSDSFAGVERYVSDTATELAARGWRVTVIGGDPARMRRELPAEVEHVAATTVVEVFRRLWAADPANVLHAHMTAAELPAALLKRRTGSRLVTTRHFAAPRGSTLLGRATRPLIARRVDVQIAISDYVAGRVDGTSAVIHNGVRTAEGASGRSREVLVVQRLEAEKDTSTALRAWAGSKLGERGWRLTIFGRGSELATLQQAARQLGVLHTVRFAGFTDDPSKAMAGASIFLATAPGEHFGLAVVEAMAHGLPVVAARGGAHEETLGDLGRFFGPGDAAECADWLAMLADSAPERERLGNALQRRQREEFSITAHVDKLERVYAGELIT